MFLSFFFQVFALSSSLTLSCWLALSPIVDGRVLAEGLFGSLMVGYLLTMLIGASRQGKLHPGASFGANLGVCAHEIAWCLHAPEVVLVHLSQCLPKHGWVLQHAQAHRQQWRSAISLRSWGEVIRIEVEALPDGSSLVQMYSRPRLPLTLVDYGQHRRNLSRVRSLLAGLPTE